MNPTLIRKILFPLHEKIMGRKTFQYLAELEAQQWLDKNALEALRFFKLQRLLMHANNNIPFYRQRFKNCGFDPGTMQDMDDIKKIPPVSKAEIRANLETMIWKSCPGGLFKYNTGGSSGEPLIFYFDRRRQAMDAAARALTHKWFGIDFGEKELYLWGSPVELKKQDRLKQIRDFLINSLLISAYDISLNNVPDIYRKMIRFSPKCIFGYPSTLSIFCSMAQKLHLSLKDTGVKVVFTTAEVLYGHQRKTISSAFGDIPVADCYGSREGGFISHQCEKGVYHTIDPCFVVELLANGRPAEIGQDGEIVITGLDAWGMPFIRYRTGDFAQPLDKKCSCGRAWGSISGIKGRAADYLTTPDGRKQHSSSLTTIIRTIEGIVEFKIIQQDIHTIDVLLKTAPDIYQDTSTQTIVSGFRKRMGANVSVNIEFVDTIERDPSGKFRYVVSKLARK